MNMGTPNKIMAFILLRYTNAINNKIDILSKIAKTAQPPNVSCLVRIYDQRR